MDDRLAQARATLEALSVQELHEAIKQQKDRIQKFSTKIQTLNLLISRFLTQRVSEEGLLSFYQAILKSKTEQPNRVPDAWNRAWGSVIKNEDLQNHTLVEASRRVFNEIKTPLEVGGLVEKLRLNGFRFKTDNPEWSVEVVLSRNKDVFERVRPHVYRLRTAESKYVVVMERDEEEKR